MKAMLDPNGDLAGFQKRLREKEVDARKQLDELTRYLRG